MESSIHKIPRTPFSNALTSFIDKYLNKRSSNIIKKFSSDDVSLKYFYHFFEKKLFPEMKKSKIGALTEENLKQKTRNGFIFG